ncbi:hypothetical protein E2C01_056711 [Portunus trituberculatus]|uniref:Uncharacterized protein n=1 Tax=Portunus trituberculatus TaxID=210409 RepID=A0A5B7GUW8_PORTR|nr:hypothetical protein [Portunus trituberculatus]
MIRWPCRLTLVKEEEVEGEQEEGTGQFWSGLGPVSKGVIQFEGLHVIFHVGRARDGTVPRLGRNSSKIQVRFLLDRLGLKRNT